MKSTNRFVGFVAVVALLCVATYASVALANHSWGGYHWARTSNPFTLKLGDNLTSAWDPYLTTASNDWNVSDVLDTAIVAGGTNNTKGRLTPKNCLATSGKVEVCNAKYGSNGWLGIASVWVNGSHIVQGTVKLNDTYFNSTYYNKPEWRNLVMCQEIAHTFGLDHQDEDFNNPALGTCMDYTSDPTPNQHPNQHDYDQLATIYEHLDTTTSVAPASAGSNGAEASEWGREIRRSADGRHSVFEKHLGNGQRLFTFVIWADPQ